MTEKFNPTSKKWWKKEIDKSIEGQEPSWKNRWSRFVSNKLSSPKIENQETETNLELETKLVQWTIKATENGYEISRVL